MLHVFKWSRNAHITFFSDTSQCMLIKPWIFFAKKTLNFYFKTRNHLKDEITGFVINTRLFTTLKNVDMFKIIEFYQFMHSAFAVESTSKFSLCILWKMVLFMHDFQTWWRVQSIVKCKYFLLFYHNNIMLKTDIMLDYW